MNGQNQSQEVILTFKVNQVVTLVAVTGAEYVGKYRTESTTEYVIGDPHIVSPTETSLGFMPTVAMTGEPNIGEVSFQKTGIILVVPTAEPVSKEYTKASSGIELL